MVEEIAPRPRVLHLLSLWEWRAPAEEIVDLCRSLRRRGHEVDLACAQAPAGAESSLEQAARERHVDPINDFHLRKSLNPFIAQRDIRRLTEFLERDEVQIVHVHTANDHYIGSRAAHRARNQPAVVRTNHLGAPLPATWRERRIICGFTDAWIAPALSCRDEDVRKFGLDEDRAIAVEPAVDLERFNPAARPEARAALGFAPEHVVAGFAAGPETLDGGVLLPALAQAMNAESSLRGLVLGTGPEIAALRRTAQELGIADRLAFAADRTADEADCIAATDFGIFLTPGPDGSSAAARETLAMGKPVMVSRGGFLPELVEDGRCGVVVDETTEKLAEALGRWARSRPLRERLGRAAAVRARERFDAERQMETISDLYRLLVEGA